MSEKDNHGEYEKIKIIDDAPKKRGLHKTGSVWTKIFAALALVFVIAFCIALTYKPDAPKSFTTPEKAITYLVGRIKAGDERGALRAFSFTHKANNLNYGEYMALEGFYAFRTQAAPNNMRVLNEVFFKAQAANGVRALILCANAGGERIISSLGKSVSEVPVSELAPLLVSDGASRLRFEKADVVALPRTLDTEAMRFAAAYDYTEAREYYVLVRLGQQRYYFGVTLVKTSDGWQIDGVGHTISHRNEGLLRAIDEQAYDLLVSQN